MNCTMRSPCRKCGGQEGKLETRGGQDCIFCATCGTFNYNAPKIETGRKPRSVLAAHEQCRCPKQRARILIRANGCCELCRSQATVEHPLHVGHLISVKAGLLQGLTIEQINSDENLAAMCDACNIGLSSDIVPLWLAVAIVQARVKNIGVEP